MTEDFALIDFALSARAPAEIAEALGHIRVHGAKGVADPPKPKGFLARIFGRGKGGVDGAEPKSGLMIQPEGTLPPPPLVRAVLADTSGIKDGPIRITGPIGSAGLTLIEFREDDGETSPLCESLSGALRGDEVFYFRHSGSRHPGAHFAFHVYQDGHATRRAVSASVLGTAPESDWYGLDSGMPHPVETDSLPAPGAPNREIMTPVRQATILEALGIDPDVLFDQQGDATFIALELSEEPGGTPVSEARHMVETLRRAALAAANPEMPDAAPDGPQAETTADIDRAAGQEAPHPRAPDGDDILAPTAPWEDQAPAPSWEEEVTALLVSAVEAALPPEEHVEWLESLTERLVAGDIDTALEEAQQMIRSGNRTDGEKAAAETRLYELFGREK